MAVTHTSPFTSKTALTSDVHFAARNVLAIYCYILLQHTSVPCQALIQNFGIRALPAKAVKAKRGRDTTSISQHDG
jgi:hypothetical protein